MPEPFDPYRMWLGIAPKDQPANCYRLLGIDLFESEPKVIESAADRQMAHLRTFQTGQHADLSQRLLNEVARAKVTLLQPAKKAAYDRHLKAQLHSQRTKAAPATNDDVIPLAKSPAAALPPQSALEEFSMPVRSITASLTRQKGFLHQLLVLGVTTGVLSVLGALVYYFTSGDSRPVAKHETAATPANKQAAPQSPAPSPRRSPQPSLSPPERPAASSSQPPEVAVPKAPPTSAAEDLVPPRGNVTPPDEPEKPAAAPAPQEAPLKVPAGPAAAGPPKRPVPEGETLQRAMGLVRDLFAREYEQAKTPRQKSDCAKKLLVQAEQAADDPAGQYALLKTATDIAAKIGDAETALLCLDRMDTAYQIDVIELKAGALAKAGPALHLPPDLMRLLELTNLLIERAIAAERLETAEQMADLLMETAKKLRESEIRKQATARLKQVRALRQQKTAVDEALAVLRQTPADPEANQTVGQYRCLVRGNWQEGLACLAQAGDPELKAAAQKDLAAPPQPDRQIETGDAWWNMAEGKEVAIQLHLLERAVFWYRKAGPQLTGLAKAKAEKRIEQFEQRYSLAVAPASTSSLPPSPTPSGPPSAPAYRSALPAPSRSSPGRVVAQPSGPPPADPFERAAAEKAAQAVDLLPLTNPDKSAIQGTWNRTKDGIEVSAGSGFNRLALAGKIKGSFQWEVQFTPLEGQDSIVFLFPVGNACPYVELDGGKGRWSGLGVIAGDTPGDRGNPTTRPGRLNQVRHTLVLQVRLLTNDQVSVRAMLDGAALLAWQGARSAVAGDDSWKLPQTGTLGLGAGNCRVVFHNASIRSIDDRAPKGAP